MGVELPLRVVVTILECCVTFSGVKLSIRSFVLLQNEQDIATIQSSNENFDIIALCSDLRQMATDIPENNQLLNLD